MCALLICLPVVVVVFLPETEEVKRRKGLTCPFFTDVPVTINLSSGLNRHEVLRNKKKKWILQNPLSLLIREVYYISSSTERNLQMSVKSEAALQWFFFFTTLCDWSSKLAPYTRTTRSKTKKNTVLSTSDFPRLR